MKFALSATFSILSILSLPTFSQVDIPGRIEAENYSEYSDTTAPNLGGQYRSDGVDIEVTSDTGGGYNIGWIAAGEYLSYPINVEQTGIFKITLRVASLTNKGVINVTLEGERLTTSHLTFSPTGGWQNWTDISFTSPLKQGDYDLKVEFLSDAMNLNYIDIEWIDTIAITPSPVPITPTVAENPTAIPNPTLAPTLNLSPATIMINPRSEPNPTLPPTLTVTPTNTPIATPTLASMPTSVPTTTATPQPVTPAPTPSNDASFCPDTHFIDTQGRCVKWVSLGGFGFPVNYAFCEYPSEPSYSGGTYTRSLEACVSPETPIIIDANSVDCPPPFERNNNGVCLHRAERRNCFYPSLCPEAL